MTSSLRWAAATAALLVVATAARAQDVLPAGWRELPAEGLATAASQAFAAGQAMSPAGLRELTEHVWTTYLDDADFVADGDWRTVSLLSRDFGGRWSLIAEASEGAPPPRVATFRERLGARLAAQPPAGESFAAACATDEAMVGMEASPQERATRAAAWMEANDWRRLSLGEQATLAAMLHAEQVPVESFSVRWSGFLTPPQGGEYVFEQLRQHHIDGQMRVTLDDVVVLDSATMAVPVAEGSPYRQVRSQPVTLAAGQRLPITVEYRYDVESMRATREFLERINPMAVLAWQRGTGAQEIVPASAFQPPQGTESGLQGEYFADAQFGRSVASRLDPGVQMAWTKQQVEQEYWETQILSSFADEQAEIARRCRDALLSGEAWVQETDAARCLALDVPRIMQRLPARDRLAILRSLAESPEALEAATPQAVRFLLAPSFMLSAEETGDFLAAWVERRQAPANEIGWYPGWGAHGFITRVYDDYGWVGHFMRGASWPTAQRLLEEHLEREDGSCNLLTAYCVLMAAIFDGRGDEMVVLLDDRLADEGLVGDARASWLLARAFLEEANVGGIPRPINGLPYLVEASLVAESPAMQFRVLQEQVARCGSLGMTERLNQLLEGAEGRFPDQAPTIAAWRQSAEEHRAAHAAAEAKATTAQ